MRKGEGGERRSCRCGGVAFRGGRKGRAEGFRDLEQEQEEEGEEGSGEATRVVARRGRVTREESAGGRSVVEEA